MNNSQSLFHLVLVLVFFFTQFPVLSRSCHDNERNALLSFKSSVSVFSEWNRLLSWQQENRNCCAWDGIQCSPDSFHVVALDLHNTINGTISPSLFNLIHLQYLDLSLNDFQSSAIPQGFAKLKKLTHLDLSYSYFVGSITTQFANLSSLRYLDVSFVGNYGALRTSTNWLKGLVNLKVLKLSRLDLSSSANKNWAEPISYLSDLRELDLSECGISGSIPVNEFLNLSRLSTLNLNFNGHLDHSSIPVQLANLTSLSVLGLIECQLEGSIPYLPQLEELDVGGNSDLKVNLNWMIEHWHKLNTLFISVTHVIPSILSSNLNTSSSSLVNLFASDCSIQGSFPTSILKLSQLEVLDLSGNNLTGQLPSSISNLKNLRSLQLHGNNFQGSIPETLCEVSSLQELTLSGNNLTGNVPLVSYINELNLTSLYLSSNSITVEIDQHDSPSKFQLEVLMLQSCNMKGYIPPFICNFTHLERLDLSHNNLIGDIPFCLFRLPNLYELDLSVNKLQGTLPRSLHYLRDVNLSSNNLKGLLPLMSRKFGSFDLSHNSFTGFSIEAGKRLFNAAYVYLSGNKLSGSIPLSLCSSKNDLSDNDFGPLTSLDLSNNSLTGTIPSSLSYCIELKSLNLGMNKLIGNVPNELGRLKNLQYLQLNDNTLNGTFLNFIGKLQLLQVFNLANNSFGGNIPTLIGSLHDLKILSLRSNTFSGSIPKEINGLHQLQIFDLSSNHFSGPIPREIGDLKMLISRTDNRSGFYYDDLYMLDTDFKMVVKGIMIQFERLYKYNSGIDLSCNNLRGSIPKDIGLLKELVMLNLSRNSLSGHIPNSIGKMIGLQSLDLSFNKLSGDIPQTLTSMDALGYFNLSFNNLSGRIPEGRHLETLGGENGSAYFGNCLLCGPPTNKSCPSDDMVRKGEDVEDVEDVEDEDVSEKWLLCGIVFLGFAVGFWGLFLVLLLKKEKWWFGYWRAIDNIAVRIAGALWKK